MSDDLVATVASWLKVAENHGLLTPTRVHVGLGRESYPSKRNLTMSPELAAAFHAKEKAGA